MATLTVWKFDDAGAAEKAVATLESLAKQQMINLQDAATVSWPAGAKKPKTRQLRSMTAAGALGGSFWGLLFGLIFFVPLLGLAVGAAMGALGGSMSDVGIDDDFIKRARNEITPGTSALFLMSSDAVIDKVRDAFSGQRAELVSTNLSNDQEAQPARGVLRVRVRVGTPTADGISVAGDRRSGCRTSSWTGPDHRRAEPDINSEQAALPVGFLLLLVGLVLCFAGVRSLRLTGLCAGFALAWMIAELFGATSPSDSSSP